jgi:hypothetical protein
MNNTLITLSPKTSKHQIQAAFDAATTLLIFDQNVQLFILADSNAASSEAFVKTIEPILQKFCQNFDSVSIFCVSRNPVGLLKTIPCNNEQWNNHLHAASAVLNF